MIAGSIRSMRSFFLHAALYSLILIFFPLKRGYAQSIDVVFSSNIDLDGTGGVLFLGNLTSFTPSGLQTTNHLFTVKLIPGPDTTSVSLKFTLQSRKYSNYIVRAETFPFDLVPGERREITNLDISMSRVEGIVAKPIDFNFDAITKLQESLLRTNRLPNDTYTITVELLSAENQSIRLDEFIKEFDISNPTTIDLFGPGLLVNNDFCPDVFSSFPQFSWNSNAVKFILTVCQVEDENVSPEDVMQNDPRARITIERGVDFFSAPSIVYPSVGVLPLLEGRTYYWQVQAVVESPGGEVLLPGEIWCFRVARLDDATRRLMSSGILNVLRSLLAGTPYENILDEGGPLDGFAPTGKIKYNGRDVDMFDLIELIRSASTGNVVISNVTVE